MDDHYSFSTLRGSESILQSGIIIRTIQNIYQSFIKLVNIEFGSFPRQKTTVAFQNVILAVHLVDGWLKVYLPETRK